MQSTESPVHGRNEIITLSQSNVSRPESEIVTLLQKKTIKAKSNVELILCNKISNFGQKTGFYIPTFFCNYPGRFLIKCSKVSKITDSHFHKHLRKSPDIPSPREFFKATGKQIVPGLPLVYRCGLHDSQCLLLVQFNNNDGSENPNLSKTRLIKWGTTEK